MVSRRLLLSAILLAGFGTACTALVLGKVGDTEDYKTVPTGSTSGGSSLDECSLLKGGYNSDHDANACSTCIQTSCASDVAYACNAGKSAKPWFSKLKTCAQNPWNGFAPPSEGTGYSTSYGCATYAKPVDAVSDKGSDTERDPQAHNCVTTSCMQGELPPCLQCEVHIKKSESEQAEALLRDDPCGSCLVENCQPSLVKCCDTGGMDDFVKRCAFTALPANKAACLELGKAVPDAGANTNTYYNDAGARCLDEISACFKKNCLARCSQ